MITGARCQGRTVALDIAAHCPRGAVPNAARSGGLALAHWLHAARPGALRDGRPSAGESGTLAWRWVSQAANQRRRLGAAIDKSLVGVWTTLAGEGGALTRPDGVLIISVRLQAGVQACFRISRWRNRTTPTYPTFEPNFLSTPSSLPPVVDCTLGRPLLARQLASAGALAH